MTVSPNSLNPHISMHTHVMLNYEEMTAGVILDAIDRIESGQRELCDKWRDSVKEIWSKV